MSPKGVGVGAGRRRGASFRTWGRTASCRPDAIARAGSVDDVRRALDGARRSGRRVKAVGSGHSFPNIACTDGVLVDISGLRGLRSIDHASGRASLWAGTTIGDAADALAAAGMAFTSLGDIGAQTLAGAIATGTHGTGDHMVSLSSQVVGIDLVTADGDLVSCDAGDGPDLLGAAQVGLGALGVVVGVTFAVEPVFNLASTYDVVPWEEMLDSFHATVAAHEHFEFFWFPHTDVALTTAHDRTERVPRPPRPLRHWVNSVLMANHVWNGLLFATRAWPGLTPAVNRWMAGLAGPGRRVLRGDRAFVNDRRVRFAEMEYNVPREAVVPLLREVRNGIGARDLRIGFPIEVRVGAPEAPWLHPSHGRASAWLAVHVPHWTPVREREEYFGMVEAYALEAGGRPHWGKLHSLGAAEVADRYPMLGDFVRVRDSLDPQRLFANAYLERVLG